MRAAIARGNHTLRTLARRLAGDTRASLLTLSALMLPVMLGMGALALDAERGFNQRVRNQAVADAAALSAALAYQQTSNNGVLLTTAQDIAVANGLTSGQVAAAVVSNYPANGQTAVQATITVPVDFTLARTLGFPATYNVTATSYASLTSSVAYNPCFLALSTSSSSFTTSGGATITAATCDLATNGSASFGSTAIVANAIIASQSVTNGSGSISANLIQYGTTWTNPGWNLAVPALSNIRQGSATFPDPWANNANMLSMRSLIGTYSAPAALADPTTSNGANADWKFANNPSSTVSSYQTSSGVFVVPAGTYYIKSLSVSGGISVTFASGSNIFIDNGFSNSGNTVNFGNSNVYVNGGFSSGSSGFTMGNGTLWIGSGGNVNLSGTNVVGNGSVTINNAISLNGGSTLKMGAGAHSTGAIGIGGGSWLWLGDGDLNVTGDISVGGGSQFITGAGNVRVGANHGTSISLSGSGVFIAGDGQFSTAGGITSAGGSRLVIGSTSVHYINGDLSVAGSALFGTGSYVINGGFSNGTGGTVWPWTSSVTGTAYGNTLSSVSVTGYDMAGVNVSFVMSGTVNLAGGAKTMLVAPAGTGLGAIVDLLVDSATTSSTTWSGGAGTVFVGTVHVPNSAVTMSGGSATLSAGQCFSLIASTIKVSGGAQTGSACLSVPATVVSSGGSVALVG